MAPPAATILCAIAGQQLFPNESHLSVSLSRILYPVILKLSYFSIFPGNARLTGECLTP